MLNEAVRAALLARDLPAHLWPEVYMAMCHTKNVVPSSALQRERQKVIKRQQECEQEEMNLDAKADAAGQDDAAGTKGTSDQGEPWGLQTKKKAAPHEIRIQDMIPYFIISEEFRGLVEQLKPSGVPCFVHGRRDHIRHLEERGVQGFYMGPGSGPSMERNFLREQGSGAIKQYRHALIHVVIYMHALYAWLTVQMLWQMHARTLQAAHMLIVCMGMF